MRQSREKKIFYCIFHASLENLKTVMFFNRQNILILVLVCEKETAGRQAHSIRVVEKLSTHSIF